MTLGPVLMLLANVLMCITPVARTLHHRRGERMVAVGSNLRTAFPAPVPPPPLADLAARAEAAIDDLDRGVIATGETYAQAAQARA